VTIPSGNDQQRGRAFGLTSAVVPRGNDEQRGRDPVGYCRHVAVLPPGGNDEQRGRDPVTITTDRERGATGLEAADPPAMQLAHVAMIGDAAGLVSRPQLVTIPSGNDRRRGRDLVTVTTDRERGATGRDAADPPAMQLAHVAMIGDAAGRLV